MLTFTYWNWASIFNEIIIQIAIDTWSGEFKVGDMTDGVTCIALRNTDIMPKSAIDQCDEMYDKIVSRKYVAMAGPMYDNLDNQILAEGERFDLEDYISMDFLLDNVIDEIG